MQKHWDILLRLVHNIKFSKGSICILCLWSLFVCLACNDSHNEGVNRLNEISYAYHYRNLDSTELYARKALRLSSDYPSGKAEALNNLAFVNIARMNYKLATKQLDSISLITDNQLELLIADVQHMRLCQRQAQNKNFYEYKECAKKRLRRIQEEEDNLSAHLQKRLTYAKTEYSFVSSTYFYYVGLIPQSRSAIREIKNDGLMQKDTAQYLNWLYQIGSGEMLQTKKHETTLQKEYEMLLECYLLAKQHGYVYWEANSLQALSEHLFDKGNRIFISERNRETIRLVNFDNMPDSLLAGYLAQKSYEIFSSYGDVYQMAGSIRTLAKCYWEIGDSHSAIFWLNRSLNIDNGKIMQAPDLVASIREQMSIVYSSLNDKHNSDINRNIYLDMQEKTRQDMELDARASQLSKTADMLNAMISCIIILIVLLSFLIFKLLKNNKRNVLNESSVKESLKVFSANNSLEIKMLEGKVEEMNEKLAIILFDTDRNEARNIENRAKVFLVESIKPLIERIRVEIDRLKSKKEDPQTVKSRYEYIMELTEKIDEYNDLLTQWIQLRQGEIGMHVESFPLADIFNTLSHSKTIFSMQGIKLSIAHTEYTVKADKILTLFMINTIADNAKKFTPKGGEVKIYATEKDDYIEISVADTGKGIQEDEIQNIFNRDIKNGHGFGLLNCRGILNRYKKYSKIFAPCNLSVETEEGKGSRFFFSLPKGVSRLILLMAIFTTTNSFAQTSERYTGETVLLNMASAYADSAYESNINAKYEQTLRYADSVRLYLNRIYLRKCPNGKELMVACRNNEDLAAELQWLHKGLKTDYYIILSIRNECAVAALALHKWNLYNYNNDVYTRLFKEVSADSTLGDYCRIMQKSETNKNIAITFLIILLCVLLSVCYIIFYRRTIRLHSIDDIFSIISRLLEDNSDIGGKIKRISELEKSPYYKETEQVINGVILVLNEAKGNIKRINDKITSIEEEMKKKSFERDRLYVSNNVLENCLSTIKHETMYYPSRINKYAMDVSSNTLNNEKLDTLQEMVEYYKELYFTLCQQLHKQTDSIFIRCQATDISDITGIQGLKVYGERFAVLMLFDILKKQNGNVTPKCSVSSESSKQVTISIDMENFNYMLSEVNELFVPKKANLPFLICRQIVREIENATNICGCGIMAESRDSCLILFLTLPNAK